MSIKKSFSEYFSFTKSERNGIIFLITLIFILIIVITFNDYFIVKGKTDFSEFEKELKEFQSSFNSSNSENKKLDTLFFFNPNDISSEQMALLGFSSKQINIIIKLRSKSFKFKKKEDLLKIYGFDTILFNKIKNYIYLDSNINNSNSSWEKNKNKIEELFSFDPNNISIEELIKFGFNRKQTNNIKSYLEKGGKFYKKEDLKRIYSINEDFYNKIEPFIIIDTLDFKSTNTSKNLKNTEKLNLNLIDSLELIKINGIGPSYAKRILKYRNMLGGFYDINQLKEVYGVSEEYYNSIYFHFLISHADIKKININKATFKEINSHPYIDYKLTKAIIDVREFNGNYNNINELLTYNLVEKEKFEKIKNYLTIN